MICSRFPDLVRSLPRAVGPRAFALSAAWLAATALAPTQAEAQADLPRVNEILASDAVPNAFFGQDVDVSDDWFVASAPQRPGGAVYVYQRGGLLQETKLVAEDGLGVAFGHCVSLSGDQLAIGDPSYDGQRGRVHLYRRQGAQWVEIEAFHGRNFQDRFGSAVDLDLPNGRLLVGVSGENDRGAGRVYQWNGAQWGFQQKVQPPAAQLGDGHGYSVALDGDTLILGGPFADLAEGQVNVFDFAAGSWGHDEVIRAKGAQSGDLFGLSVDLDGDQCIVGCPGRDDVQADVGAAYVFQRRLPNWVRTGTFLSSHPESSSLFGLSVGLEGGAALVGSPLEDVLNSDNGCVYQYRERDGEWLKQARYIDMSWSADLLLGYSCALSGNTVVAGLPGRHDGGDDAGAVHVYSLSDFSLVVDPAHLGLGVTANLDHHGGAPGRLVGLFVMQVDGAPFIRKLVLGLLDAEGRWSLQGSNGDPALSGLDIGLQSFSLDENSKVIASNPASIHLQ